MYIYSRMGLNDRLNTIDCVVQNAVFYERQCFVKDSFLGKMCFNKDCVFVKDYVARSWKIESGCLKDFFGSDTCLLYVHISIPGCAEWGLKLNLGKGKLGPTVLNLVKRSARIYRPFLATLPVSLSLFISLHHRSWIKKEEKAKVVAAVVAALVIVHYTTFWRIVPGWFEEKDLIQIVLLLNTVHYIAS